MARGTKTIDELRAALERCPQAIAIDLLGLERSTIRNRIKSGDYPDAGQGRTDLFVAARHERQRQKAGIVSLEAQRLKRAQADKAELEALRLRGELVSVDEEAEVLTEILAALVRMTEALAARLGPIVDNETDPALRREALQGEIRELRQKCSDDLASMGTRGARR